MLLSRQKILLLALCAVLSTGYGCSNSQTASEGELAEGSVPDSQADSVGSIPEDLLASEEKGQSTENAESTDPFSDLQEGEKHEAAAPPAASESEAPMSLIENGDEKAAAAEHSSGSGNMETYTVKSGDTLMKIAFTIYGDIDRWKDLQEWNSGKIKKAAALRRGMKLKYEAPMSAFEPEQHAHTYTIKKGDTLANIADEVYGRKMKYKKLQNYNSKLIRNPNRIFAGFTIYYDITAKEIAEAEARRQERLAASGGSVTPAPTSMVPSAIAPPTQDFAPTAPAPIAIAPQTLAPSNSGAVPAPASTNEMAPPPPPPMNQ